LEPSTATYNNMVASMSKLPSFDGADMGFLNAYFDQWASEHRLFQPSVTQNGKCDNGTGYWQLSNIYNYQIHWFNNERWGIGGSDRLEEGEQPIIIQFASSVKPWHALGYLSKPSFWLWYQVRQNVLPSYDLVAPTQAATLPLVIICTLLIWYSIMSKPVVVVRKQVLPIAILVGDLVGILIGLSTIESSWHPISAYTHIALWLATAILGTAALVARDTVLLLQVMVLAMAEGMILLATVTWAPCCVQLKLHAALVQFLVLLRLQTLLLSGAGLTKVSICQILALVIGSFLIVLYIASVIQI